MHTWMLICAFIEDKTNIIRIMYNPSYKLCVTSGHLGREYLPEAYNGTEGKQETMRTES
jgi:hypothetical protein